MSKEADRRHNEKRKTNPEYIAWQSSYNAKRRQDPEYRARMKAYLYDYCRTDEYRFAQSQRVKKYRQKIKGELFEIMGGECIFCGFDDYRALQIDHVNGDGFQDRKDGAEGIQFYKKVLESFSNDENKYQLLCSNCNWIKRCENNELPYADNNTNL